MLAEMKDKKSLKLKFTLFINQERIKEFMVHAGYNIIVLILN